MVKIPMNFKPNKDVLPALINEDAEKNRLNSIEQQKSFFEEEKKKEDNLSKILRNL
jgi:hypothetical protein